AEGEATATHPRDRGSGGQGRRGGQDHAAGPGDVDGRVAAGEVERAAGEGDGAGRVIHRQGVEQERSGNVVGGGGGGGLGGRGAEDQRGGRRRGRHGAAHPVRADRPVAAGGIVPGGLRRSLRRDRQEYEQRRAEGGAARAEWQGASHGCVLRSQFVN